MADSQAEQLLQQGLLEHRAGRLREAEIAYRRILEIDPNHVDALSFLGVLAGQTGHADEAIPLIRRAISLQPNQHVLHFNLAAAFRQAGQNESAIDAYRRGLSLHEDPQILVELGNVCRQQGQMQEAYQAYTRSLSLTPSAAALHALGSLYMQSNQFPQAAEMLKRAVDHDPNNAAGLRDLAVALAHIDTAIEDPRMREMAAQYLQRAVDLPCTSADDFFVRGIALNTLSRADQAHEAFAQALRVNPDFLPARLNLGISASLLGRNDEAMDAYAKVVAAEPNAALAHVAYGMALLFAGRYAEGWPEYAWRWKSPPPAPQPRSYTQPAWQGQDLTGKTLLLYGEQGFGDTINFARYATLAAQRGARVILQVPQQLLSLMRSLKGVEQVIAEDQPLPQFDLHAPLMDLPMIFGTTVDTIPADVPYLNANAAKINQWAAILAKDEPQGRPALRVGLAWSGNPQRHQNRTRSIPLEQFALLGMLEFSGVVFFNLQKGPAAKQLPPLTLHLRDYTDDLHDFDDTAALMQNMDLIITVDTAISHLAGALALPVWTLLSLGPDWRYMANRADIPWYPTMRLFRQQRWNSWTEVVRDVTTALDNLLKKKSSDE